MDYGIIMNYGWFLKNYGVWRLGKFKAAVNAKTASGTFVQHDDPVCILDGRKAMSNDHDGTSVTHSASAQVISWKNHLDALRGFWNFGTPDFTAIQIITSSCRVGDEGS